MKDPCEFVAKFAPNIDWYRLGNPDAPIRVTLSWPDVLDRQDEHTSVVVGAVGRNLEEALERLRDQIERARAEHAQMEEKP